MTTTAPTTTTGQLLGYARVSTTTQTIDRQIDALTAAGIPADRVYVDRKTGAHTQREGFQSLLAYARAGDVIVVYTLDRLGRSLRDTLNVVHELGERGVGLRTLADPLPIDTSDDSPTASIALTLLGLFAELERTYNKERVAHARAVAGSKGVRAGRPRALSDEQLRYATHLRDVEGLTVGEVAERLGVSQATLYRRLPVREVLAPTASGAIAERN